MGLQGCHYKTRGYKTPARTTNGPAPDNSKEQIMPTGACGLERKKKSGKLSIVKEYAKYVVSNNIFHLYLTYIGENLDI